MLAYLRIVSLILVVLGSITTADSWMHLRQGASPNVDWSDLSRYEAIARLLLGFSAALYAISLLGIAMIRRSSWWGSLLLGGAILIPIPVTMFLGVTWLLEDLGEEIAKATGVGFGGAFIWRSVRFA